MEKQIPVMQHALELTDTILEGLVHTQQALNKGQFSETMYLVEDIVAAFATIEQSLQPIHHNLKSNALQMSERQVRDALEHTVQAYEENDRGNVQATMQFTLIPNMKSWKKEMEHAFHPYTVS